MAAAGTPAAGTPAAATQAARAAVREPGRRSGALVPDRPAREARPGRARVTGHEAAAPAAEAPGATPRDARRASAQPHGGPARASSLGTGVAGRSAQATR